MRVRRLCCTAAVCLAAVALAGCGSASGGLSASSAGGLRGQLAAVQTAAANGNRTAALNALSSFSAQVEREAGALSSAERAALRTGIARVRERIMQTVAPATTAASTPTSTSPTPPAVTTSTPPTDAAPPASHHGGPKGAGPSDHPKHDGQHGGHGGGKADGKANGD